MTNHQQVEQAHRRAHEIVAMRDGGATLDEITERYKPAFQRKNAKRIVRRARVLVARDERVNA